MDKLNIFKTRNKLMYFLIILFIIGIISGSIFISIIDIEQLKTINNNLNSYFEGLNNIEYLSILKSDLLYNIIYLLIIWLLGVSIIGIPIILAIYFFNSFIFGFTISSIISTFKYKGIIYGLLYVFPSYIINILIFAYVSMYGLAFSYRLIRSIVKKQDINIKEMFSKYKKILFKSLLLLIISILFNTFITSNILKLIYNLLN